MTRVALREPTERVDLGDEFRQQRENLEQLLENIRETVEEAEEAEPLMAKQLYDSLREAQHQRVDDALDTTRRLLDRDLTDEARRAEEQAAQGIENLREGVENAARECPRKRGRGTPQSPRSRWKTWHKN